MLKTSARHLIDRLLRTTTARRMLMSIRWRSGLDDELQEIRSRTDGVRGCLEEARAALAQDIRDVSNVLGGRLGDLERTAGSRSRLEAVDARVRGLEAELPGLKSRLRLFGPGSEPEPRFGQLDRRLAGALEEHIGALETSVANLDARIAELEADIAALGARLA